MVEVISSVTLCPWPSWASAHPSRARVPVTLKRTPPGSHQSYCPRTEAGGPFIFLLRPHRHVLTLPGEVGTMPTR